MEQSLCQLVPNNQGMTQAYKQNLCEEWCEHEWIEVQCGSSRLRMRKQKMIKLLFLCYVQWKRYCLKASWNKYYTEEDPNDLIILRWQKEAITICLKLPKNDKDNWLKLEVITISTPFSLSDDAIIIGKQLIVQ